MNRTRITGAIASLGTAVLLASAASASASGVYSGGALVSVGSSLDFQSTGNVTFRLGSKTDTCSNFTANLPLTQNPGAGAPGSVFSDVANSFTFNNGGGADCTVTGFTGYSTSVYSLNTPLALSADRSVLRFHKQGGNVTFTRVARRTGGGTLVCTYDDGGAGLTGVISGSQVTFTNVPLRKVSGPALCTGTGTLGSTSITTAPVNVTTSGAPVSFVD